jgi:hypothetical protein
MIKHNTNKDYTVKLSTVLDECLDYNFKNRIYVDKMEGINFAEKLQNAINEVNEGGTICITSESQDLLIEQMKFIEIDKSVTLLGIGKIKPKLNFLDSSESIKIRITGKYSSTGEPIVVNF